MASSLTPSNLENLQPARPSYGQSLISGGLAGIAVDTVLFPLDTVKTRLQSQHGFVKSGGFKGVYSGLGSAVIGSAPGAALFFVTYDAIKLALGDSPHVHMLAASLGEVTACLVRVPTELVKQRMQSKLHKTTLGALQTILSEPPRNIPILNMYKGFFTTVAREIPFTCLQFPLYEYLKGAYGQYQGKPVSPLQAAICGSIAGGTAAALTTPLDVAKTRIMLSQKGDIMRVYSGTYATLRRIATEEGFKKLFLGVGPRTVWISIGGSIFLGVYEWVRKTLMDYHLLD